MKKILFKDIIARLQGTTLLALCGFAVLFASATPAFADTKLVTAIEAGDMAAVRAALDGGANVNERDMRDEVTPETAWTPLMAACRAGQFGMARELVERKADINARDGVGATAFLLAAELPGSSEFLQYLQGRGANIHGSMDAVGGALECAAAVTPDIEVLRTLIAMGLDKDREGGAQSARFVDSCYIAAARGNPNPEVIKLFVKTGAGLLARDLEDNALAWEGWRIEEKPERLEWLKKNTDLSIPAQAATDARTSAPSDDAAFNYKDEKLNGETAEAQFGEKHAEFSKIQNITKQEENGMSFDEFLTKAALFLIVLIFLVIYFRYAKWREEKFIAAIPEEFKYVHASLICFESGIIAIDLRNKKILLSPRAVRNKKAPRKIYNFSDIQGYERDSHIRYGKSTSTTMYDLRLHVNDPKSPTWQFSYEYKKDIDSLELFVSSALDGTLPDIDERMIIHDYESIEAFESLLSSGTGAQGAGRNQ